MQAAANQHPKNKKNPASHQDPTSAPRLILKSMQSLSDWKHISRTIAISPAITKALPQPSMSMRISTLI
jgi:hypothetical protein